MNQVERGCSAKDQKFIIKFERASPPWVLYHLRVVSFKTAFLSFHIYLEMEKGSFSQQPIRGARLIIEQEKLTGGSASILT